MPFVKNTTTLIGRRLFFKTHCGNDWMLYKPGQPFQIVGFPPPFESLLTEIIIDENEVRALVCKMDITLAGQSFSWGAFIARSDSFIDLTNERVEANLLLSNEKPTRSNEHPYHHPGFVQANSEIEVRGFGTLSLSKNTPKDKK